MRHTNRMLFDINNPRKFLSNFRGSIQVLALRPNQMKGQKLVLYQSAYEQFTFQ